MKVEAFARHIEQLTGFQVWSAAVSEDGQLKAALQGDTTGCGFIVQRGDLPPEFYAVSAKGRWPKRMVFEAAMSEVGLPDCHAPRALRRAVRLKRVLMPEFGA